MIIKKKKINYLNISKTLQSIIFYFFTVKAFITETHIQHKIKNLKLSTQ